MNDDAIAGQDVTETPNSTADVDVLRRDEADRRSVRWHHVFLLTIAVLVCAAGAGFFVTQSSDREDATNQRKAARAALAAQRVATNHSRYQLASDRDAAKATLHSVAQLTTALHELTDFSSQETDVMNQSHQLAVSNPDAVDQYNELVGRGNVLIDQMNAQGQQIATLADQLRRQRQAQPTASTAVTAASRTMESAVDPDGQLCAGGWISQVVMKSGSMTTSAVLSVFG